MKRQRDRSSTFRKALNMGPYIGWADDGVDVISTWLVVSRQIDDILIQDSFGGDTITKWMWDIETKTQTGELVSKRN